MTSEESLSTSMLAFGLFHVIAAVNWKAFLKICAFGFVFWTWLTKEYGITS
jgi:hypothetical protein